MLHTSGRSPSETALQSSPCCASFSAETQDELSHLQTDAIAVMDFGSGFSSQESSSGLLPRRFRRKPSHPVTPDKNKACSKRTFDGMVRSWMPVSM